MQPLHGLRIIDTTDERGALCGRLLGDLGADVTYVEPPSGSPFRQAPPFAPVPPAADGTTSLAFAFRSAGKRSVTLDLSTPKGQEEMHQFLAAADAWIESNLPGSLAAYGLDPESALRRHPHLVITSITDFGQTGPYRNYLGTDMIGYAMGGMLYRAGAARRPPLVAPGAQAYDTAAITAAFGTVTALHHRGRTGRGQWLDVSVQEATSNLADWSVPLLTTLGFYTHREGAGMYPVYRCTDGWLRMIVLPLKHWRALRAWMGEPAELQDPAFDEYVQRIANRPQIEAVIQRFLAGWSKEAAAREAQARDIPATPVLSLGEVLDNEHTRARGTFAELEILEGLRARVPSGFFEFDGVRCGPTTKAPSPGEHTEVVAAEVRTRTRRDAAQPAAVAGADAGFPLAGVRVLDFGIGVAGVEVGRLMVEYGAEVIKIESSHAADFVRNVIPGPMNAAFVSANRSKLSFGVNLKTPEGVALARRLVSKADVLIENSATGTMERFGLGYERLRQINPRLIMFSTQMLGSSGPWKDWSGYGPNAHAVSGLQWLWNYWQDRDRPEGSTNIHPDHLVGRLGALGIVAALRRREGDGCGAHIQVAQFEVLVQLLGDLFIKESLAPGSVQPQGNDSERGAPWGAYPCAGEDEWCVINVRTDAEWRALRVALGAPDWMESPQYDSAPGRRQARDAIDEALSAWTCTRSPAEVMALLQGHRVPAAVVEHPAHQLDDPHLKERGFFRHVDQPALGPVKVEGAGFLASGMPSARVEPAPLLGQHTRMICRSWLDMSDAEIDSLVNAGAIEEARLP
ncbi:MAG: putative family CoA-transferase [Deltaproteobacteria bacterium]|nr:putative family CoA-transferase [Deltaproteobacteria bacterium]